MYIYCSPGKGSKNLDERKQKGKEYDSTCEGTSYKEPMNILDH